jgi:hypothetical protein
MASLDYRIFDADTHYYEPDDCFTRHIEARFKERTVWIDRSGSGPGRMYVGKERCHFFSVGAGDSVGPPGIMKAFLRGDSEEGGSPSLSPINALAVPEFVDRSARLATMDAQNVEACLILPTAGVGVETQLRETPDVLYPSLRAYNRWLEDDWGFGADGRLYGAPLLSLFDPRCSACRARARAGRRCTLCNPLPLGRVAGRSPADPAFRSILGALRRGRIERRLPHRPHALQRDVQSALGPASAPAVAPPFADGMGAVVH